MKRVVSLAALVAASLLAGADASADEGQWMPKQIAELDRGELSRLGLELSPEEVWNPDDFGLMAAIVNLSGCSAGFVSSKALIATNHHCAHAAIQSQSTVEHDYLTDGFLARAHKDELRAKGRTVTVLRSITDVTSEVREVVEGEPDPAARSLAKQQAMKKVVKRCEDKAPGNRCRVASFYNGSEYQLFESFEIEDIRIVFAPPSAVGNYGGEVDNWMWPRHSGDFTLLRAYVGPDGNPAPYSENNVPYEPKRWLSVSPEGVEPGDFVAVLGFPGHTDRYLPVPEAQRQLEQFLPARVDLYGAWIAILEEQGAADPAIKIKVAATLRGLANRYKNSRGMIEGIQKIGLLQRRRAEEAQMAKWAENADEKYRDVLPAMAKLAEDRRAGFNRDFLVSNARRAAGSLAIAVDLVRRAKERQKPDLERQERFMDRGEKRLWSGIETRLRNFDRGVDQALLSEFLRREAALPADQRFTGASPSAAARLVKTKVTDAAFAREQFDAPDWAQLEKSSDPMIALARKIVVAVEQLEADDRRRDGESLRLGPLYFEMLRGVRAGPIYPDANGTLRFSYATVREYSPRDGITSTPQTTVTGQLAKHTGEDPFDLPKKVRDAAPNAKSSRWAAAKLGDVPVCFLSSADTTGGNSGSPVVDGKGRFVGLNFDRVWENIAGDFGYHISRSRNITVDARYLLWILDEVEGASELLAEIGVDKAASTVARAPGAPTTSADGKGAVGIAQAGATPEPAAAASGCSCGSRGQRQGWWLLLLPMLPLMRRRR